MFSLQVLSPLANGLFQKVIMESGVAIIPLMKAPDEERNEDVGILSALVWLPLLGQERTWSGVSRLCTWLSSPTMAQEPELAQGEPCCSVEDPVQ